MLKFLRKYNKLILVIGGSMLMVAFLAPQAIQQLGQIRNPRIGTLDGRTIKQQELDKAGAELRAINLLAGTGDTANLLLGLTAESSAEAELHWYLLTREAEQGGFVGSDQDGRAFYPFIAQQLAIAEVQSNPEFRQFAQQLGARVAQEFAQQQAAQRVPQWLERIERTENNAASSARMTSLADLHKAVAKLRGVLRMRQAFNTASSFSVPRATTLGVERFRRVELDHVVVPAERYLDAVPEPSEAEIALHYEQYADLNPIESEDGIGYLQPRRIKIEWMVLDRNAIDQAVTVPATEMSKHFLANRERFPGELSAEREAVERELREQAVERLLDEAERTVRGYMLQQTRSIPRADDLLELPDDWAATRPSLETIAQQVVDRLRESEGIEIPAPEIVRLDDTWQTFNELAQQEGMLGSQVSVGSLQVRGPAAPFQVVELVGAGSVEAQRMPMQVGALATRFPLEEFNGTRRFFRVLDARDVSPPDSIEEVREDVIRDLKRLRAYETMLAELEQYADVARAGGLEAVVDAMNAGLTEEDTARVTLGTGFETGTRPAAQSFGPFRDQAVLDQIFEATRGIDPTVEPEMIPLADRVITATSTRSLSAIVAAVQRVTPLTVEDFRLQTGGITSTLLGDELAELEGLEDPYSLEQLIERHGWVPRSGERTDATESPVEAEDDSDSDTR
ncbi:MAG: hypothetical protein AAGB48_03860 [Planctomycetota bacterium]